MEKGQLRVSVIQNDDHAFTFCVSDWDLPMSLHTIPLQAPGYKTTLHLPPGRALSETLDFDGEHLLGIIIGLRDFKEGEQPTIYDVEASFDITGGDDFVDAHFVLKESL